MVEMYDLTRHVFGFCPRALTVILVPDLFDKYTNKQPENVKAIDTRGGRLECQNDSTVHCRPDEIGIV